MGEPEILEDKLGKADLSGEELIRLRKDKVIRFLREKYLWIIYIFLALIVFLAGWIRTRNLPRLRDITTGGWTLGPDLDPFLFLRWSKYIVENGSLFAVDKMRYVPLGYSTDQELLLHPYMMAWFHKVASLFGSESVTQSAAIYPVFMFVLTVVAFFLLSRKIFEKLGPVKSNIIGLLSSLFLSIIPVMLPRTIAGIPEKESAAFLFMFLAFYFFLSSWSSKNQKWQITLAVLAGMSTAGMALIWGGFGFIFLTIGVSFFFAYVIGAIDKRKFLVYSIWLVSSFTLMFPFTSRYGLTSVLSSVNTAISIGVFLLVGVHIILFNTKIKDNKYLQKYLKKAEAYPVKIGVSILVSIVLFSILGTILLGVSFLPSQISQVINSLSNSQVSRLIQTVAENRQPYFVEWSGSFGPVFNGFPVFFWLFFIGSIFLFYKAINPIKTTERIMITLSYVVLIFAITFSRYSSNSTLNGSSFFSNLVYAGGFIIFLGVVGRYYYLYTKRGEFDRLKNINFNYILILVLFILNIFAARSAIRLVMVLAVPSSIIVSFFVVEGLSSSLRLKDKMLKMVAIVLAVALLLVTSFAGWQFYKAISPQAENFAPSRYTNQWQKSMSWVRENTPEDAVFGHWWDYGYWLQSIGERATVLDGGNALSYWNHLMGRHALTGTSNRNALEFLYAHETTHFLIDSSDIGKYAAFSSIGSDTTYDRRSWIPTFQRDNSQVQERKNSTAYLYTGGTVLDGDIIYEQNSSRVFLPAQKAGIGAIILDVDSSNNLVTNPVGVFVYEGNRYEIPLRYAFSNGEFIDFGSGIEAGVYIFPRVSQSSDQLSLEPNGALMYLSERTVKSQLARLYLYNEDNPNFKLAHSEDNLFVSELKSQNPNINDIILFNGKILGPIKIWEINYPEDIEFKEEYVQVHYPKELQFT